MGVEFEWHFENEVPEKAPEKERRPRRPRWRLWLGVASLALLLVALGLYVRWRTQREALALAEEEVQAVARLELQALEEQDTELYLSLQDGTDPHWQEAQKARAASGILLPPPLPGLSPAGAVSVEDARVVADTARVEMAHQVALPDGQLAPFRAIRFYRRNDDGRWLHTKADLGYAGNTIAFTGRRVVVTCFDVDAENLRVVVSRLERTAGRFCDLVSCSVSAPLTLSFTDTLDGTEEMGMALPAPFLAGVPADEAAREGWESALQELLLDRLIAREAGLPAGAARYYGGELFYARWREWMRAELGLREAMPPPDLDLVGQALDKDQWVSLGELWTFALPPDDPRRRLAEAEIDLLLAFIEEEYGPAKVAEMLIALHKAPGVGGAIWDALGENWLTFELGYAAYVRQVTGRPGEAQYEFGPVAPFAGYDLVLACEGNTNLWGVRLDSPEPARLSSAAGFGALLWSPDGTQLLARRNAIHGGGCYLLEASGSAVRQLMSVPPEAIPLGWSPDGRYVAYSTFGPSLEGGVVDVNADQSAKLDGCYSLAWSPGTTDTTSLRLAYVTFANSASGPTLWLADADGSNARQIGPGSSLAWSPDGTHLAISSAQDEPRLAMYNVETGETTTLLDAPALYALLDLDEERTYVNVETLAWSPAGDWIGFAINQYDNRTGPLGGSLGLVRPDGSEPHALLSDQGGVYLNQWSPDGRWMVAVTYAGSQLTTTVKGVDGQTLFESSTWAAGVLSPDGRYLALVEMEMDEARVPRVLEIATGDVHSFPLPGYCGSLAWNPRGTPHELVPGALYTAPP